MEVRDRGGPSLHDGKKDGQHQYVGQRLHSSPIRSMRRISYCCSPAAVLCLVLGRLEDVSSQAPVPPQYDRLRELVIQKKAKR